MKCICVLQSIFGNQELTDVVTVSISTVPLGVSFSALIYYYILNGCEISMFSSISKQLHNGWRGATKGE